MTVVFNPALIAFAQITLALLLLYLCIVVLKYFRDATSTLQPDKRRDGLSRAQSTQAATSRRVSSASTLTRQQP